MSLTLGHGPLSAQPADANYQIQGPAHRIFVEDSPKRVRVEVAGETLADTERAKLLHETGLLPVYYFPRADVRFELLSPSARTSRCPYKGIARYWDVVTGDKKLEHAVWAYPEPLPLPCRCSRTCWPFTSTAWTPCTRRTKSCSATRATPTIAWTCAAASATCGYGSGVS